MLNHKRRVIAVCNCGSGRETARRSARWSGWNPHFPILKNYFPGLGNHFPGLKNGFLGLKTAGPDLQNHCQKFSKGLPNHETIFKALRNGNSMLLRRLLNFHKVAQGYKGNALTLGKSRLMLLNAALSQPSGLKCQFCRQENPNAEKAVTNLLQKQMSRTPFAKYFKIIIDNVVMPCLSQGRKP